MPHYSLAECFGTHPFSFIIAVEEGYVVLTKQILK
jgi:hypothetical protein